MKLTDWPLEHGCNDELMCGYKPDSVPGMEGKPYVIVECGDEIRGVGRSLGGLIRSIVEHARTTHGVEIERDGSWYRAYTPDGKLWAESSSVDDFGPADLDGMEGEELEYWTDHNETEKTLRYQRIDVYTMDVVNDGWHPEVTEGESS